MDIRVTFRLGLLGLLIAIVSFPAHAARVVVLGDSLSDAYNMPRESGWVHLVDQRLGTRHQVIDAAISGDTTAGALARVDDLLQQYRPQVLIVILGGNDGLRGLNPARMERNLAGIIERGRAAGAEVLLMQIRLPANLGPIYLERFEAVYPRLAEQHDIRLLDFFLEDLFDQPGMLMADGIHPTIKAQPRLADRVEPVLREVLGGFADNREAE
ncbi:MAG: arylesterase [Wenzhouxiangellaceae bacterium]